MTVQSKLRYVETVVALFVTRNALLALEEWEVLGQFSTSLGDLGHLVGIFAGVMFLAYLFHFKYT